MGDNFEDEMKAQAEAPARHEAGHYIVARVLGFRTGELKIASGILGGLGGAGIDLHCKMSEIPEVRDYLERRLQVLYAGAIAEHIEHGKLDQKTLNEAFCSTARDDFAKISENLRTLCSISDIDASNLKPEIDNRANDLINKAAEIVTAEEPLIQAVSTALLNSMSETGKFSLSLSEIEAIPEFRARFDSGG